MIVDVTISSFQERMRKLASLSAAVVRKKIKISSLEMREYQIREFLKKNQPYASDLRFALVIWQDGKVKSVLQPNSKKHIVAIAQNAIVFERHN